MKILVNSKVVLIKPDIIFAKILADELTIKNPLYIEAKKANRSTYGINKVIKNFNVDNCGNYHMPRGYLYRIIDVFKQLNVEIEIEDNRHCSNVNWPKHIIMPRKYQYTALTEMSIYPEGILVSPAGSGKTIMGIGLIQMSQQKALWLTHTNELAKQSMERLHEMVPNLNEDDIGLIGGGKWKVGNLFTIGMVQTLVRNVDELKKISNEFGIIIIDECHHTPSTTFSYVISQLNAYYMYALTATEKRRDGLEILLYQNVGPIRHIVDRDKLKDVNAIITPSIKPKFLDTKNITGETYSEILESLMHNDIRNNEIVTDVIREASQNNICMLATERREHADILFKLVHEIWPNSGIATGSYNKKHNNETIKQFELGNITVLVTTTHLLGEGFDHKPLNRLFIGLPFRNATKCEQVVGRIQRTSKGKKCAVIYDYVDSSHGLLKHQYKNNGQKGCRYNVYKLLGCSFIED